MKEDQLIDIEALKKLKTVIANYGLFFVFWLFIVSCGPKEDIGDKPVYEGPIMRLDSINTVISDSAIIMLQIKAAMEEVFENGDREWKKGLYLQYFDNEGTPSSTFKSDYASFSKKENLYKGTGNVIVQNITNGDEMKTEELFWDPEKKEFYTERFVTIRTEDEIHTGEGLTSNQDFSVYKILKPAGTFTIEEGTTQSF